MGGSMNMFPFMSFGAQQSQAAPQYTNDQLLSYARSNNGNFGELEKYGNEIVSQLKAGTYQDPYKVWQAVRDSNFKADPGIQAQNAFAQLLSSGGDIPNGG